jgi:ATP-dependent Lon protease
VALERVGVANGVAWSEAGGELLSIEVSLLPGAGQLVLTGRLGDTMRESAQTAISWVRSRARQLGLDPGFHRTLDLHVHVPEGDVPKNGPSAGVTIALALVSALTERPTLHDVAASGEISLHGRVLPVGGLAEKAIAAHRAEMSTLLLPESNRRHLGEIPEDVRAALEIVLVSTMDEVLKLGLAKRRRSSKGRKSSEGYCAA